MHNMIENVIIKTYGEHDGQQGRMQRKDRVKQEE